ncbi:MAG: Mth938-like domain-containing protein [Lysobacter sp.]
MQITLENPDHEFVLRGADGVAARVNDSLLGRSFVIAPDRLIEDWAVRDARSMQASDLEPLLALQPEVLLLGSGSGQAFPPAAVLAECLRRGIGIEVMGNDAAARTFNVLASEGRKVVAGFILPG